MRKFLALLGLLGLVAAAPVSAVPLSDLFIIYDREGQVAYKWGVYEDGVLHYGACQGPLCGEAESPANIYYLPIAGLVDPGQFGNPTILLEEGGGQSDIFGIASIGGGLFLAFASDGDPGGNVNFGQFPIQLPETDLPFDATMYLDLGLQAQGYTATFQSAEIPLPGTLLLLGLGLAGLGFARRRLA